MIHRKLAFFSGTFYFYMVKYGGKTRPFSVRQRDLVRLRVIGYMVVCGGE